MFYIMRAYHISEKPRKVSLATVVAEEPTCTVLVANRETGWNKTAPCFVIGSAGNYGVKTGDVTEYTIDTGNGHRRGGALTIRDVLRYKDGKLVEGCHADIHPSAHAWVMK